jgi:outer membrane lipoprotein-sorting protein
MKKIIALVFVCSIFTVAKGQDKPVPVTDAEAGAILEKASAKYGSLKGLEADFTLTTVNPKLKPEDPDSKYTSTNTGQLYMKGKAFKLVMKGNEIYCDGKTIWSYSQKSNEVQVNDYEESQETFSPTKIFSAYKEGYSYQIKEKKTYQGKNITVIELAPTNHKMSFFKIDVAIEDNTNDLLESKIYEKSGVRYIYTINKLNTTVSLNDMFFSFDSKKYPNVKTTDLR